MFKTIIAGCCMSLAASTLSSGRELSFEERVAAQEAVERVHYAHQVGARKAFEAAVPHVVLEAKVRAYLAASDTLGKRGTPIDAAMLHHEAARMRSSSAMPERLREIEAALGDDPLLFEECVARAALAERLMRGLPDRALAPPLPAICAADETWDNASLDDPPAQPARYQHTAVWTGSVMIVWGGIGSGSTGSRYDPATDTWTPTSTVGAPGPRYYHTAVWTGSEMIVWGGSTATGGRYDPMQDTWAPTATLGAPQLREFHTAVWTGTRMVVWGGKRLDTLTLNTGGQYDPVSDSWSPTSLVNAPTPRDRHTAVWTGSEMIVWGGYNYDTAFSADAARYDPATDTWHGMSLVNAPFPRIWHSAVWTGDRMIVFGGQGEGLPTATGGMYFPAQDAWQATSTSGAHFNAFHTAVWTGDHMIVWGGRATNGDDRYDPATDTWSPLSTVNAPAHRWQHTAVWTGSHMIIWGGMGDQGVLHDGGRWATGHLVDNDGDGLSECAGDCNDGNPAAHPGAVDVCNRADDDCDGIIDMGDGDADGFDECQGDCNDANAAAHPGAPEVCDGVDNDCNGGIDDILEVCDGQDNDCDGSTDENALPPKAPRLLFASKTTLQWLPTYGVYDLVKGNVAPLRTSHGNFSTSLTACVTNDSAGTTSIDPSVPGAGGGLYYLLRAYGCGQGTYDSGSPAQPVSRDPGIGASPAACP